MARSDQSSYPAILRLDLMRAQWEMSVEEKPGMAMKGGTRRQLRIQWKNGK